MSIQEFSSSVLAATGSLNWVLAGAIFFIFVIGEFGLSIPYLMETVWILVGVQIRTTMPVFDIFPLLLVSMAGRLVGATIFYNIVGLGRTWLLKIYGRIFKFAVSPEKANPNNFAAKLLRKINLFSPFSVAFGRLIWLKIPLTLTLSISKRPKPLLLGAIISGLVWDAAYILIGLVMGRAKMEPYQTLLYSLSALTLIYALSFIVKHILSRRTARVSQPVVEEKLAEKPEEIDR
jgi:membrane protein DedA with SNARE-associated domain